MTSLVPEALPVEPHDRHSVAKIAWAETDPLGSGRGGDGVSPLDVISGLAQPVPINRTMFDVTDVADPFPLSAAGSIANESWVEGTESQSEMTVERLAKPKLADPARAARAPVAYSIQPGDKNYMKFLLEQTADLIESNEGSKLHDRMSQVWDNLGFTIQQKLEMAVKYSTGAEDSSKFTDAVVIWENAYATVLAYEKAYKELKDVIRMEVNIQSKAPSFDRYRMQLETAERNIMEITTTLKMQFNDEFVIRRKKAAELLEMRRMKINALLQQQGSTTIMLSQQQHE
jgi:hypothetical protein